MMNHPPPKGTLPSSCRLLFHACGLFLARAADKMSLCSYKSAKVWYPSDIFSTSAAGARCIMLRTSFLAVAIVITAFSSSGASGFTNESAAFRLMYSSIFVTVHLCAAVGAKIMRIMFPHIKSALAYRTN